MVLLDTHVWIWAATGESRLGRAARRLIDREAARDQVRVSVASVFEVSALATAGRLRLSVPVERWVEDALDQPGIRLAELTAGAALDAGQVTRESLADPLDRILFSTARRLGASLMTADRALLAFAKQERVAAVDAAR